MPRGAMIPMTAIGPASQRLAAMLMPAVRLPEFQWTLSPLEVAPSRRWEMLPLLAALRPHPTAATLHRPRRSTTLHPVACCFR
jgi:hypothetical protein